MADRATQTSEAARLARRAVELGGEDAVALYSGGYVLAWAVGELDTGAVFIQRALTLSPNLAEAWICSGWLRINLGEPEVALEHFARAMRLNPLGPLILQTQLGIGYAHFFAGRYDEASSWAENALRIRPNYFVALRIAAASHALAGRLEQAQKIAARIREHDPSYRISDLAHRMWVWRSEYLHRYAGALRKAGLPD